MGLCVVIQKVVPYPSASQSFSWFSSWSCVRGIPCPAVLTQAFLPQGGGFGQCHCFGQAEQLPPHWKSVLAHFAKLIKAVSAVSYHDRCCRSIYQFAHLKACLEAKLMGSPWVWTATEKN